MPRSIRQERKATNTGAPPDLRYWSRLGAEETLPSLPSLNPDQQAVEVATTTEIEQGRWSLKQLLSTLKEMSIKAHVPHILMLATTGLLYLQCQTEFDASLCCS
jgi:hypothetical protein